MDFSLSKEQRLIQITAREFAEKTLAPLRERIEAENDIPQEVFDSLRELELGGIPHRVEYGGGGGDYLSYALALAEMGKYSSGAASIVTSNNLSMNALAKFGSEEQRMKWMPDCLALNLFSSFAFTEPATGSDPKSIESTAVRDGDTWVINGTKRFITNAHLPGPLIIFAKDDTSGYPTAFLIEKFCEGYSISERWDKVGFLGSHVNDIYMKDIVIPAENQVGELGLGYKILQGNIAFGKLSISSLALGRAEAALECAVDYAKNKTRRGVPISNYGTMKYRLADMEARLEAARNMVYRLAWIATNATDLNKVAMESAKTKIIATRTATEVCRDAMQCMGSYAPMKEYRVEQLYRDSMIGELIEGVDDVQHIIVAGHMGLK